MTEVSWEVIKEAAAVILQGGIVAFPTETYYGLAVDPFNEKALARLFELKKRDISKAILTLVDNEGGLSHLTDEIAPVYKPVMERFWPGPLTLLFPAKDGVSPVLTGDTGMVGIRISSHPVARQICSMVNLPVTATSANISGRQAAVSAWEVRCHFGEDVDLVLDGGRTKGGLGSTIVAAEGWSLKLVRNGAFPFEKLVEFVGGYKHRE